MAEGLDNDATPAPRTIDAFDYFPARQSRIGRLGGHESFSDPSYAFHTHYQPCTAGPLTFKVSIRDLTATYGTLVLRVNVIPVDLRFDPKLAKTAPVSLPTLAENGGEISIEVMAKDGMLYALLGHVYEETDALASAITITVQQAANQQLSAGDLPANVETLYRPAESGGAVHLLSGNPASLTKPVSQVCTPVQLSGRVFETWAKRLGGEGVSPVRLWPSVYILQALAAYGMLAPGARGLGFGYPPADGLPAVMASEGCAVVVLQPAGSPDLVLPREPAGDDESFDQNLSVRCRDDESIPADLVGFDFLWSQALCDRLGSVPEAEAFLLGSLDRLKLGGIAVHTLTLGLTPNVADIDTLSGLVIPRNVLERVAISLISHGHEVSQIRYDKTSLTPSRWGGAPSRTTARRGGMEIVPFGLIIRKGHA